MKRNSHKCPSPWYNLRNLLGHASWGCMFYIILASRQTGKDFVCKIIVYLNERKIQII